ncbi:hypothetical protein BO94DRAFT_247453 [Aspergillus sclerotioniger CBS 115572]|uniref:Uncharacterized protein n=1 Tax=Aspergillus sclerotioniger CBS 115572 TaxID=1450535 RepID=A0A317VHN9_9EURO|nr:hypothetical protein BO94DRAFT_247453 [Aspergillus sclerotioniger CBS 115572]PWY72538.1 hypothetical protein BO94DRAFT_247453 [Aspergillus sclerotioniger CBS 115572]
MSQNGVYERRRSTSPDGQIKSMCESKFWYMNVPDGQPSINLPSVGPVAGEGNHQKEPHVRYMQSERKKKGGGGCKNKDEAKCRKDEKVKMGITPGKGRDQNPLPILDSITPRPISVIRSARLHSRTFRYSKRDEKKLERKCGDKKGGCG